MKIIPFATIEIMSKGLGVAADYKGKFQIEISTDYQKDTIRIGSLGYVTRKLTVESLKSKYTNVSIELQPDTYSLPEIEVAGIPSGKSVLVIIKKQKEDMVAVW
ncbi:MAG: carboxypeptidase-like regulatory domain-containing protein [Bacteroidales bacterium]|jgi:purine-nucleoside phosphorylase|nr:carboxypeptidase-like regulatory domain-containing protein [Bacteroidales bacterium]